jgi:hypothetical protein
LMPNPSVAFLILMLITMKKIKNPTNCTIVSVVIAIEVKGLQSWLLSIAKLMESPMIGMPALKNLLHVSCLLHNDKPKNEHEDLRILNVATSAMVNEEVCWRCEFCILGKRITAITSLFRLDTAISVIVIT